MRFSMGCLLDCGALLAAGVGGIGSGDGGPDAVLEIVDRSILVVARQSLVLLAVAGLWIALKINWPTNRVVQFMARNSMALYCLQPFFFGPAAFLVPQYRVLSLLVVMGLSYVGAALLRPFVKPDLID